MKMLTISKLVFLSLFMTSCTTIHFDNGDTGSGGLTKEQWHHNYFAAIYEGSSTVDLERICSNKEWRSVKTEESLENGISAIIVGAILPSIWYPKTVTVKCAR